MALRYTTPGCATRNDIRVNPILHTGEHPQLRMNVGLQNPTTAGLLRLTSGNIHVQPELNYRYLSDPWDRERMRMAIHRMVQLSLQPSMQELIIERIVPTDQGLASDDALDAWILANARTQHHSSGTCKMGPASDPMAVVDQYCRVHGVESLRVVDASVMPDVVRANTNATTIMIAERVADWIK